MAPSYYGRKKFSMTVIDNFAPSKFSFLQIHLIDGCQINFSEWWLFGVGRKLILRNAYFDVRTNFHLGKRKWASTRKVSL